MSTLNDLRERLEKAARTLDEAAPSYWEDVERCRIRGKAEGVRLALSYVEEALRTKPNGEAGSQLRAEVEAVIRHWERTPALRRGTAAAEMRRALHRADATTRGEQSAETNESDGTDA